MIYPQLPREQTDFRRGSSTVDQITLLTQDIDDGFQVNEKAGVMLLDLTATYDTMWLRGLHLKLLKTVQDKHLVSFIMEILTYRSFTLMTSDGQNSRLRKLKNGIPLAPLLFKIYIHDLPEITSNKYGFVDDLAIHLHRPTWEAVDEGLNEDMNILAAHLNRWRLQLSKTVSAAFHLNHKHSNGMLSVFVNNKRLGFQATPAYPGVTLERTLTFRQHLEKMKAKAISRVSLTRRLGCTQWGAAAKILRISTQALFSLLPNTAHQSGAGVPTKKEAGCP